jgi:hypothetical protein
LTVHTAARREPGRDEWQGPAGTAPGDELLDHAAIESGTD